MLAKPAESRVFEMLTKEERALVREVKTGVNARTGHAVFVVHIAIDDAQNFLDALSGTHGGDELALDLSEKFLAAYAQFSGAGAEPLKVN